MIAAAFGEAGMASAGVFTGGCQCGAVRYRAAGERSRASVCYCRMCQKAGGAPFMAFVRFRAGQVEWSAKPAVFASSNLVERGFCAACGTPLSYRQVDGPWISLTLHSLDRPEEVAPETSFSAAMRPGWIAGLADLPETPVGFSGDGAMVSNQHADG